MKILIFYPILSVNTGSGIRATLIIDGLIHCGVTVGVVSDELPDFLDGRGLFFYPLADQEGWKASLIESVAAFKPDIIFGITEVAADLISSVGKESNIPVVLDLHGLGFIECLEMGGAIIPRLFGIYYSLRRLFKIHSVSAITLANPTLEPVLKPLARRTLSVFGMTDVDLFRPDGPKAKLGCDPGCIQVLYAGNFRKWQGVEKLVEAINLLGTDVEKFEFTFLGSFGKDQSRVAQWQKKFPLGRVHFVEAVGHDRVSEFCRAADVLVLPRPFMLSTYFALPQKLLDYMATGGCIVATDIAPHRWALSDSAGILCAPSARGVAEGLLKAASADLRHEVGIRARERALERFCYLQQCKKIKIFLEEIVATEEGKQ